MREPYTLEKELKKFDGKHVEVLEHLAKQNAKNGPAIEELIDLFINVDPKIQSAETWILKNWSEDRITLPAKSLTKLFALGTQIRNWEAKFHIWQMFPFVQIPAVSKLYVESFLKGCLADDNKFVRAGAYNDELKRKVEVAGFAA